MTTQQTPPSMPPVPRVGVAAIIERDNRVLLIRRGGAHGGGTWSTPGGHLDHGETPEQCAIREVQEEVGVTLSGVRFRGVTNDIFPESGKHYITLWMQGTIAQGDEPTIIAPREVTALGWYAWDTLPEPLFAPLTNLVSGRVYVTES